MAGVSKAALWLIILTVIICSCAAAFTGFFLRRKRYVYFNLILNIEFKIRDISDHDVTFNERKEL